MNTLYITIMLFEVFGFGIWLGYAASSRNPPNEPKPKNWDDLKFQEWRRGYKAGEKNAFAAIKKKCSLEQLYRGYMDKEE